MKITIPSPQESLIDKNGKPANIWFTFFNNIIKRMIGQQDGFFGCVLSNDVEIKANSGSSLTELMTYNLGKSVLKTTSDFLIIEGSGQFASNANNKSLSLSFDSTEIFSISPTAINGGSWLIRAKIVRVSQNSQSIIVEGNGTNSVLIKTVNTSTTKNLAEELNIAFNATGVSSNDILQNILTIQAFIQ